MIPDFWDEVVSAKVQATSLTRKNMCKSTNKITIDGERERDRHKKT